MSRIAPQQPSRLREPRHEDRRYLDSFEGQACESCGIQDGTVVPAHFTIGWMRRGEKPHDWLVAGLCMTCHALADEGTWDARIDVWLRVLRRLMENRYAKWRGE